jgi:small subunit ribosomal protein S7
MSRRKAAPKRTILKDPLFGSELITKFMNVVMVDGKKSIAERIVYGALDDVVTKVKDSAFKDKKDSDEDGSGEGGVTSRVAGSIHSCEHARALALQTFEKALDNLMPTVEVKSRRVGGSTYQVPVEVRSTRRTALAMRWLQEFSRKRGEKTMAQRLANEILDAINERGNAFKKKEDVHRMARANQAFAHYRW